LTQLDKKGRRLNTEKKEDRGRSNAEVNPETPLLFVLVKFKYMRYEPWSDTEM
jgi:hypothetical protein